MNFIEFLLLRKPSHKINVFVNLWDASLHTLHVLFHYFYNNILLLAIELNLTLFTGDGQEPRRRRFYPKNMAKKVDERSWFRVHQKVRPMLGRAVAAPLTMTGWFTTWSKIDTIFCGWCLSPTSQLHKCATGHKTKSFCRPLRHLRPTSAPPFCQSHRTSCWLLS